jgi:hAT family C-terminal dimerisation region
VSQHGFILEYFDSNNFQLVNIRQEVINQNSEGFSSIRISCFIHTLQLAIRDGLHKAFQISKVLEKCKLLARCSQQSTKIADLLDHLHKHIERTTVTRWNSEFMMVKSILSINSEDLESISNLMENPIRFSQKDLTIMKELIDILEPFYEISLKCQAEKIATVSFVVPSIVHLYSHLQSCNDSSVLCKKLVQQLQSAIEERFTGIIGRLRLLDVKADDPFNDPLYFMATVLDPAFKFYWIHDLHLPDTTEARLKQHISQLIIDETSRDAKPTTPEMVSPIEAMNSLSTISSSSASVNSRFKRRKLFVYDEYRYKNSNSNVSRVSGPIKELDAYLNDPVECSFSEYWQRSQLMTLKKLVVRVFSVQASSAPVERVFSHAGLIFSSRRTRMSEQLFRDLVFLKVNQVLL